MRAFWNLHGPGCNEHLLVHKLRNSPDYLPQFSRVAELDGNIVGAIFYTKAYILDGDINHDIVTFGPLCVDPCAQNLGIGAMLLSATESLVRDAGYPGICIYGEPAYYPRHGFVTCDRFGITDPNGDNYDALMGFELYEGAFSKIKGKLIEADVFSKCDDKDELVRFDSHFPQYKKLTLSCQWIHEQRLGRISEIQKGGFMIRYWENEIPAKLGGAFYKDARELPVVGDYVTFNYNPHGDSRIVTVCERSSILKRPDQSGHAEAFVKTMKEQPMIANADYIFITVALGDNYNLNRIARYAAVALSVGSRPIVILTKSDLCDDPSSYVSEIRELSDSIDVHVVSSLNGTGIEELKKYFGHGNTIALMGSSGVGKSTLLNAIAGKELMKTGAVRMRDSKGRHTTTYRQLEILDDGTTIIDTPGMRELGMCDVSEGIEDTFSDIAELATHCRFNDCSHDTEPGCAIKQALSDGTLSQDRFNLYKSLQRESRRGFDLKAVAKKRRAINKHR